jgi:hypothetical protein
MGAKDQPTWEMVESWMGKSRSVFFSFFFFFRSRGTGVEPWDSDQPLLPNPILIAGIQEREVSTGSAPT